MSGTIRCKIQGIPYAQVKPGGDRAAPDRWSEAVRKQTANLPKITGPCIERVTYHLPPNKFPSDCPQGPDLDNLMKRFNDALNDTVFSDVLGKDSCVVTLEVTKVRVDSEELAGAELEIVPLNIT